MASKHPTSITLSENDTFQNQPCQSIPLGGRLEIGLCIGCLCGSNAQQCLRTCKDTWPFSIDMKPSVVNPWSMISNAFWLLVTSPKNTSEQDGVRRSNVFCERKQKGTRILCLRGLGIAHKNKTSTPGWLSWGK